MLGAIYIGMSGMTAYSKGLQAISNNVTNLNTSGYKSTSIKFTDVFERGGGTLNFGGDAEKDRNGAGVRYASPHIDFRAGDLRASTGDLDLAIQGEGFLTLLDGKNTYYARTGQFVADDKGDIIQQDTKYHLGVIGASGQPEAINIADKHSSPPVQTTKIAFADNLSSTAPTASVPNISVFDDLGGNETWTVNFKPNTTIPNTWDVTVVNQTGATVGTTQLRFIGGTVDPSTATLTITSNPTGASQHDVVLDFSQNVTSFSSGTTSTLHAASTDGSAAGVLTTVGVDADGKLKLSYSNGKTDTLAAVALTHFHDPQQLERFGNGLFRFEGDTEVRVAASGKDGLGTLLGKQLEASNVDLSAEFGDLILVQRGFQASSQVVSVSNDMIQQLFGIRGQG